MNREQAEQFVQQLRERTAQYNVLAQIATAAGRDYITPEDVSEALERGVEETKVRLDVLEIMADNAGYGVEDRSATAFVAFKGNNNE